MELGLSGFATLQRGQSRKGGGLMVKNAHFSVRRATLALPALSLAVPDTSLTPPAACLKAPDTRLAASAAWLTGPAVWLAVPACRMEMSAVWLTSPAGALAVPSNRLPPPQSARRGGRGAFFQLASGGVMSGGWVRPHAVRRVARWQELFSRPGCDPSRAFCSRERGPRKVDSR